MTYIPIVNPPLLILNTLFAGIMLTIGLLCLYAFIRDRAQYDFLWLSLLILLCLFPVTLFRNIIPSFITVTDYFGEMVTSAVSITSVPFFLFVITVYKLKKPWKQILITTTVLFLIIAIAGLVLYITATPMDTFKILIFTYSTMQTLLVLAIVIISIIKYPELRTFRAGVVTIGLIGALLISVIRTTIQAILPAGVYTPGIASVFLALFIGIGMIHDMARLYRERRGEITRLQSERDNYLAWMIHHMHIPLGIICAKMEKLCNMPAEELGEGIQKGGVTFDDLNASLRRLLGQVSNEIDNARGLPLDEIFDHHTMIDLSEFVEQKTAMFTHLSERNITTEITPGLYARIDPYALNSIVDNLLANALEANQKNEESGVDEVKVTLSRHDMLNRLTVEDHGAGLSREQQREVFAEKPFGNNIGLPFVKKALQSAHGKLTLDKPKAHDGLSVTAQLPFVEPKGWDEPVGEFIVETPKLLKIEPTQEKAEEDKPRLMLIDDNPGIRDYLKEELAGEYRVSAYGNPEDAAAALGIPFVGQKQKELELTPSHVRGGSVEVDLIITDNYFGDECHSGLDLIVKLSESAYDETPVLLISQYLTTETATLLARPRGVLQFLRKPLNPRELRMTLRMMFTRREDLQPLLELEKDEDRERIMNQLRRARDNWKLGLSRDE